MRKVRGRPMNIDHLYEIGFSLILLKPKRKQPMDDSWSKGPRVKLSEITDGLDNGCNLGFRPGVTSKTEDGFYIHGIDLDIRCPEDKEEAIKKIEELFGRKFLKQCARVVSGSGGDSRHFYFKLRRPMRAKTIAHSKEKFFDEAKNAWRWRWEIEVFGEGKQLVLPPSIHPDTGKPYVWSNEPDDMPVMVEGLLDDILDELTRPIKDYDEEDLSPLGMEYDDAEKVLEKLDFERWFVEREGWRNVGMALHHEFNGSKAAYRMWTAYSKKSKNFDADEQRYQWSTFGRNDRVRPFRMASLIKEAHETEIRDAFQPTEDDAEEIREAIRAEKARAERKPKRSADKGTAKSNGTKTTYKITQPAHLMTIPGILGEMVELFNATAPRPQPQFAPHVVLALGSVILARNWVTDMGNFASLFFLLLGRTASGKEHGLRMIDSVLDQCELDLVGPNRYTSDAGVLSALEIRPKHISLADEFSRYLKSARNSGDANQSNAQSSMMEVWGRLGGIHRNKGYSARGMSKAQVEEMANSHVKRPALTVLGVAVPEDFYTAISDDDVASGFLNRFLICETEVPRMAMQAKIGSITVSNRFRKWAREYAFPLAPGDEDIMDAINRNNPTDPGDPVVVPFTAKAKRLLTEIDIDYLGKMDDLDMQGLDGLYGRAREIIMRISLIVALSCEEEEIRVEHVTWAREYVEYHLARLVARTKGSMGASEMQRNVAAIHELIYQWSEDDSLMGMTARELTQYSRAFKNMDTRQREEVIRLLGSDYGVVIRMIKRKRQSTKMFTTRDDQ